MDCRIFCTCVPKSIAPVDYDPGTSESNQTNRIKLLMTVAWDNLKQEEENKKTASYDVKEEVEIK